MRALLRMTSLTWLVVLGCSASELPLASVGGDSTVSGTSPRQTGHASSSDQPQASPEQCQQWRESLDYLSAKILFARQTLTTDAGYADQLGGDLPADFRIDVAELRRHLGVLSNIPDPTRATGFKKPSEVLGLFTQAFDLLDTNLRSGHPFSDGSGNGERLLRLLDELHMTGRTALSIACQEAGCRW